MSSYVIPVFPAASRVPPRDALAARLAELTGRFAELSSELAAIVSAVASVSGKADKAPPSASGNLASLDASGNLLDSGATPASIKAAAVAEVVANAPGAMDTLREIADILGSAQQSGTVLKRISELESGKADSSSLAAVATSGSYDDLSGKPVIPPAVAFDATLTTQGAAADAKAVGDALRGGFTEWELDNSSLHLAWTGTGWEPRDESGQAWGIQKGNLDSVSLSWTAGVDAAAGITATRHAFPPTKTSQLTNDSGFLTSHQDVSGKADKVAGATEGNLAALDAQGDLADSGVKPSDFAAKSDLPYRLVTLGEWECSPSTVDGDPITIKRLDIEGVYYLRPFKGNSSLTDEYIIGDRGQGELEWNASQIGFDLRATRASLPGHLLDRAVNVVSVTGTTTLTLPPLVTGKSRYFYLKMTVTGSQSVTFSSSTGIAYTGFGNPAKTYSGGTHVLHFTETSENEFCVTDMLAEYAAASDIPYALVPKTPVNGTVTLSDRAVNLVNPTVTALPPVWEWSDGQNHGQPAYGVINDYGDYQEYGWGFLGEGETLSEYDSFGNYYGYAWDGEDATELSFYNYDTDESIVASLVTQYETDVSSFALPPAVTGRSRDFMVRLAMPENAAMFSWPSGVDFETEDGQMPDVSEPGVYLLAFTETGAGRFALLCRKVQGVE